MLEIPMSTARHIFLSGNLGREMSLEKITRELNSVHSVQVRELSETDTIRPVPTAQQLRKLSGDERVLVEQRYAAGVSVATYLEEGSEVSRSMARDLREIGARAFCVTWSGSRQPFGIKVGAATLYEIRHEEVFDITNRLVGSCVQINDDHNPDSVREMLVVTTR
jgi:hypothetical protein